MPIIKKNPLVPQTPNPLLEGFTPIPTITNLPSSNVPVEAPKINNTLAERFASANVAPNQPGMPPEISQALRGIYAGQVLENRPTLENQRAANLSQLRANEFAGNLSQIGNITPEMSQVAAALNPTPSLSQGIIPEVAANIGSKTAIGAAGGAVVGGLPGAAIGAAGGAITGISSVLTSLKDEARQNTKVQKVTYTSSKSNIKAIIDGVNKGVIDPIDAINLYNRELAKIDRAETNLKSLSESEWLSKAKDELVAIQSFNDNERARTTMMLQQAIIDPNPKVNFDLGTEVLTGDTAE